MHKLEVPKPEKALSISRPQVIGECVVLLC